MSDAEYQKRWRDKNIEAARALEMKSRARRRRSGQSLATYYKKRELLWDAKSKPCSDCGQSFPPYVMDFDHRDANQKTATVGRLVKDRAYGS